jgi:hypothetical protein
MQQPQHIDALIHADPEDYKVPSLPAIPSNMQGADAKFNLIASFGTQNLCKQWDGHPHPNGTKCAKVEVL